MSRDGNVVTAAAAIVVRSAAIRNGKAGRDKRSMSGNEGEELWINIMHIPGML